MRSKKLTGWLVLLIIITGPLGFGAGARSLSTIEAAYQPHIANYPSLRTAVLVFQFVVGSGVVAWIYTAWVLYRREAGTLSKAMTGFALGSFLRLAGGYAIPFFGGLPPEATQRLIQSALPGTLVVILITGLWLLYLARSERVREIYAA